MADTDLFLGKAELLGHDLHGMPVLGLRHHVVERKHRGSFPVAGTSMCLHYNGKFTGANRFLAALPADQYW